MRSAILPTSTLANNTSVEGIRDKDFHFLQTEYSGNSKLPTRRPQRMRATTRDCNEDLAPRKANRWIPKTMPICRQIPTVCSICETAVIWTHILRDTDHHETATLACSTSDECHYSGCDRCQCGATLSGHEPGRRSGRISGLWPGRRNSPARTFR